MNESARKRTLVPLSMYIREYYRSPLNLVLLVVIPVLLILSFGGALSRLADLFDQTLTVEVGNSLGALWAAAFLTGIMGFYMMTGAREADRRLVRSGYSTISVVMLRLTTVALLGLLATTTSFVVLITRVTPENYAITFAAIYLAAMIYGALGVLIGSIIPGELEGSFALLFFFIMDAFIGSPLFGTTSEVFAALPTHYPSLILSAMTAGEIHSGIHWLYATLYLAVAGVLGAYAFYQTAKVR